MAVEIEEALNLLNLSSNMKEPFAKTFIEKLSKNRPSIGLDFILEIQKKGVSSIAGCKYWCSVCKKSMTGYTLLNHISGEVHTTNFLEKAFPTIFKFVKEKKKEDSDFFSSMKFDEYLEKIALATKVKTILVIAEEEKGDVLKKFDIILENVHKLRYYDCVALQEGDVKMLERKESKFSQVKPAPIAEKLTNVLNIKAAPPKPPPMFPKTKTIEQKHSTNLIKIKKRREIKPIEPAPIADRLVLALNIKPAPLPELPEPTNAPEVKQKTSNKVPAKNSVDEMNGKENASRNIIPMETDQTDDFEDSKISTNGILAGPLSPEHVPVDENESSYVEILKQFGEFEVKELAYLDYEVDIQPDILKKPQQIYRPEFVNKQASTNLEDQAIDFEVGIDVILDNGDICTTLDMMALPNCMYLVKVESSNGDIFWTEKPLFKKYSPPIENDFRSLNHSCWGDVSDRIKDLKKTASFCVSYAASSANARKFIPRQFLVKPVVSIFPWRIYKDANGVVFIRGFEKDKSEKHCSFECMKYDWRTEEDGSLSLWQTEYPDFDSHNCVGQYMAFANLTDTIYIADSEPIMIKILKNVEKLMMTRTSEEISESILHKMPSCNILAPLDDEKGLPYINDLLISNEQIHFRSDIIGDLGLMTDPKLKLSFLLESLPTSNRINLDLLLRNVLRSSVACYSLLENLENSFKMKKELFAPVSTAEEDAAQVALMATLILIKNLQSTKIKECLREIFRNRRETVDNCLNPYLPLMLKDQLFKCSLASNALCRDAWESVRFEARMSDLPKFENLLGKKYGSSQQFNGRNPKRGINSTSRSIYLSNFGLMN